MNKQQPNIKDIEWLSKLMDSKFTIPGTNFKIGLDPIIGLIPVAGDVMSYGVSAFLITKMVKHGASKKVALKMTFNVILDMLIGMIPLIGTIFDFTYKANDRNVRLLKEHYTEGKHDGSGKGILIGLIFAMVLIIGLLGFFTFKIIAWLIN